MEKGKQDTVTLGRNETKLNLKAHFISIQVRSSEKKPLPRGRRINNVVLKEWKTSRRKQWRILTT